MRAARLLLCVAPTPHLLNTTNTHMQLPSAGNNCISKLSSIGYLRRFSKLQLVNLAGNPVARDASYK